MQCQSLWMSTIFYIQVIQTVRRICTYTEIGKLWQNTNSCLVEVFVGSYCAILPTLAHIQNLNIGKISSSTLTFRRCSPLHSIWRARLPSAPLPLLCTTCVAGVFLQEALVIKAMGSGCAGQAWGLEMEAQA